jgi:hypothetical protein
MHCVYLIQCLHEISELVPRTKTQQQISYKHMFEFFFSLIEMLYL